MATAQVSIVLETETDQTAYLVPISAVAPGQQGTQGDLCIFDPASSTVRKSPIRARGATDNMIAIHQGVKIGDVVAVAGVSFLIDGQKVKLMIP